VQSEHEPGVVLWEGKVRVEFGEKSRVGEIIVSMYPSFLERSACKVGHGVVDAGNGDGR
jgi:hypothetical protein